MSPKDVYRKKVRHYNQPGDAHFLTFSCYRRLSLLSNDRTRLWFVNALAKARVTHAFHLWAWVIMPEHVHLLIWPRLPEYEMSHILSSIKQPVGTKAIQYLQRHAARCLKELTLVNRNRTYHRFWQCGSGYDENLDKPQVIHDVIDYIHQNPVRRGLVARAEDWIWSSARDWAGLDSPLICVDRTVPPLEIIER